MIDITYESDNLLLPLLSFYEIYSHPFLSFSSIVTLSNIIIKYIGSKQMPTPSIQKSKRNTRLDTKKEKEKREREEKEFEEWKQSLTYYDRACLESRR